MALEGAGKRWKRITCASKLWKRRGGGEPGEGGDAPDMEGSGRESLKSCRGFGDGTGGPKLIVDFSRSEPPTKLGFAGSLHDLQFQLPRPCDVGTFGSELYTYCAWALGCVKIMVSQGFRVNFNSVLPGCRI